MPQSAPRPCAVPGCPVLVGGGHTRCTLHAYTRASRTARGYDEDWQRLRESFMRHPDNVLCRSCLDRNVITLAVDVDHIIPFRSRDDPRRLDRKNLQSLCKRCHSLKTRGGRKSV